MFLTLYINPSLEAISKSKKKLLISPIFLVSNTMDSRNYSFASILDDYIGAESCNDLQNDDNNIVDSDASKSNDDVGSHVNKAAKRSNSKKKSKEERVLPPPIPFLARTQNLASHMPWVLKRYTTSEGRLILKEEKVERHEYFHAHRENGRLTLQLVPLDDEVFDFFLERNELVESASSTSSLEEEVDDVDDNVSVDNNVSVDPERVEDEENVSVVENENGVGGGGSGRLKCLNYNMVPVHPIRTIRG